MTTHKDNWADLCISVECEMEIEGKIANVQL